MFYRVFRAGREGEGRDFPFHQRKRRLKTGEESRARFSKVPKLFRRISGDIIFFVSSKRRRFEARNFVVI